MTIYIRPSPHETFKRKR